MKSSSCISSRRFWPHSQANSWTNKSWTWVSTIAPNKERSATLSHTNFADSLPTWKKLFFIIIFFTLYAYSLRLYFHVEGLLFVSLSVSLLCCVRYHLYTKEKRTFIYTSVCVMYIHEIYVSLCNMITCMELLALFFTY